MSLDSTVNKEICKFFSSTKRCKFGDRCRFLHTQTAEDGALNRYSDSSGVVETKKLCRAYAESRFCKFGIKCRYQHQLPISFAAENHKNQNEGLNQQEDLGRSSATSTTEPQYFCLPLPNGNVTKRGIRKQYAGSQGGRYPRRQVEQSYNVRYDSQLQDDVSRIGEYNQTRGEPRYRSAYRGHSRRGGAAVRSTSKRHEGQSADPVPEDDPASKNSIENDNQSPSFGGVANDGSDAGAHVRRGRNTSHKQPRRRPCRYFRAGHCSMGQNCKFWHPSTDVSIPVESAGQSCNDSDVTSAEKKPIQAIMKPNEVSLDGLTDEDAEKLRNSELSQLLRRFPKAEKHIDEEYSSYKVKFVPSDPDWAYDVKKLVLTMVFPKDYPKKAMSVAVLEDQEIPETVARITERSLGDWVQTRFKNFSNQGKAELVFRPFMKWMDRTLEDIFTEGLKQYRRELMAEAAGVQFISASELQEEFAQKSNSDTSEEEADDEDDGLPPEQPSRVGSMPPNNYDDPEEVNLDPARKGTEVKLQKLELAENASTLSVSRVKVMVQCSRCKNKTEIVTPCGRANQVSCGQCSQEMIATFRANMCHQFSSIIGYMDLFNCVAFDLLLLDCLFSVGCFNCNKDMRLEGLSAGQIKESFCFHCHKKIKIYVDSVRFHQLDQGADPDRSDVHLLASEKKRRVPKDPAIQLGKPLPDEGICKHYKKSFRWFRFPCCGKVYPCDRCHDDKEDHEMTFANRMICGFCCKEQSYSADRPCVLCGSSLTKKSGTHWEGGKGCRDKVKMSRNDSKKYADMTRSVSRKTQEKNEAKGKKTTKLRHS